jgi:C-terminal processing protease CtpA/Prc
MKMVLVLSCCLALSAVPTVQADVIGDENNPNQPRTAHQELRDAVARIRQYYSPGSKLLGDVRLAGFGGQARLGIILGSAWALEDREPGALVMAVTPGSPADEAGLLAGDVITSFNGEDLVGDEDGEIISMRASQRLVELSRELEDGETVTLGYERDGSEKTAVLVARKIDIGQEIVRKFRNQDFHGAFPIYPPGRLRWSGSWFFPRAWLDLELVTLNPELGEYFGADGGVLVVRGSGGNDVLGLESGDVILSIGRREVRSPEHAMRILRSYEPEEELTVEIIRHGRSQTLVGTVPESPIDFDFRWNAGDRLDSSED